MFTVNFIEKKKIKKRDRERPFTKRFSTTIVVKLPAFYMLTDFVNVKIVT